MTSHYVTCHVTTVSHASSLSKEKKIQKKRNIKSRKIDKRKKNVSPYVHYNIINMPYFP